MVLFALLAFFGVVFGANAALVGFAVSTFGGVTTQSPYKAGLFFNRAIAEARDQDARHWRVEGKLVRGAAGEVSVDIRAQDQKGAPVTGVALVARLVHPADSRLDRAIPAQETAPGRFFGLTQAAAGQWDLVVDFYRGDERLFRSKSRVTLR
jgi:nitrogen fixation protein FixH